MMLPPNHLVKQVQLRLRAAGVPVGDVEVNELVAAHLGYRTYGAMRAGRARGRPLLEERMLAMGLTQYRDAIHKAFER